MNITKVFNYLELLKGKIDDLIEHESIKDDIVLKSDMGWMKSIFGGLKQEIDKEKARRESESIQPDPESNVHGTTSEGEEHKNLKRLGDYLDSYEQATKKNKAKPKDVPTVI